MKIIHFLVCNETLLSKMADVTLEVNQNAKDHFVFKNKSTQIILDDLSCQSETDISSYTQILRDLKLGNYFEESTLGFIFSLSYEHVLFLSFFNSISTISLLV